MDSLRDSIQKLTRSINPLGKLMDFLQEDVDSMQMELSIWKNSYTNTKLELKREEGYVIPTPVFIVGFNVGLVVLFFLYFQINRIGYRATETATSSDRIGY